MNVQKFDVIGNPRVGDVHLWQMNDGDSCMGFWWWFYECTSLFMTCYDSELCYDATIMVKLEREKFWVYS